MNLHNLSAPPRYLPLGRGTYEVTPALHPLGKDFGNGSLDGKVFQLDTSFERYRENKLSGRHERLGKYLCVHELAPEIEAGACRFIATQLAAEWPHLFSLEHSPPETILHSRLTDEFIVFNSSWTFLRALNSAANPPYASGLDALCCQIQEDVALTSRRDDRPEGWLSALHVCCPSHWAPEHKVGKSFSAVHTPVAGAAKLLKDAPRIVGGSIERGPYVRFAWGVGTDTRLNHHPEPPPDVDAKVWAGRVFDSEAATNPLVLRVERQLVWGLPLLNASFFGIHVYFVPGDEIRSNAHEKELLKSALLSMSPESLQYKGLHTHLKQVIAWLDHE